MQEIAKRLLRVSLMCAALVGAGNLSCRKVENSNTQDATIYPTSGGMFGQAQTVMASKCSACHSYHSQTEAQLKSSGAVVAGDPNNSKLYYRLTGSSGSQGPKNMPSSGSNLTTTELAIMESWISGMQ